MNIFFLPGNDRLVYAAARSEGENMRVGFSCVKT